MHEHPLHIPEIILEVLKRTHDWDGSDHVDFGDIDSAGLVCWAWRGPSMVVKWQSCPIRSLLRILAPLETTNPILVSKVSSQVNLESLLRSANASTEART